MKAINILRRFFFSSWFLALIPAMVLFLFIPPLTMKYKLMVEDKGSTFRTNFYFDLDSDGVTEMISSGKGVPYYNILVQDNDYRVYDQWNFTDDMDPEIGTFFFGNLDRDKYHEIYIFTHKGDSLFININEFLEKGGTTINHRFITKIGYVNSKATSCVYPAGFFDNDNDKHDELYFTIQTGFGLEPRRAYSYNFVTGRLKSSDFTGMICLLPSFLDTDEDNLPEMFGVMSASGNYKDPPPFSDKSTWLMVFDENLDFEFSPVEIPGFTNHMNTCFYRNEQFRGYLVTHNTGSADSSVTDPCVRLYSLTGELLKEQLHKDMDLGGGRVEVSVLGTDRIFLFGKQLLELNSDFEIISRMESPFSSNYSRYIEDMDMDGNMEFVLHSEIDERLIVLNSSLQILAEAYLRGAAPLLRFSHCFTEDKKHKVNVTSATSSAFVELHKNKYYLLGYSIYPGVYFLCLIFIILVGKINTLQIVHKESLKQRLITLQLQGIKSQLDPHFTFNSLNSVASLIYLEDREKAYDYLNKFTRLLRTMLNDAGKIYRKLGEEIDFVATYLELEKLRFGEKFNYLIETGEGVNPDDEVPKMVLQTFAENAIKHGIMPCVNGGLLKIKLERHNDYLRLVIEDNGIGREKAAGQSSSTGKGLKLTGEFYDILNEINRRPIRHAIKDLYDDSGNPAGTLVEVWVPITRTTFREGT